MSRGRPEGSKNTKTIVDVQASRCESCGSTDRSAYMGNPVVQHYAGEKDGQPYNRIVRRRCQCLGCGQFRIDRTFEFTTNTEPNSGQEETRPYRGKLPAPEQPESD